MNRILIVDDDPFIHDYLHRVLKPEYPDLVDAETIEEGWQLFEKYPPDLVLLDMTLPDGSGLDLCRRIREREPLLPVLILSARYQLQDRVNGLTGGADDYIIKPFEREDLIARVVTALRRHEAILNRPVQVSDVLEVAGLAIKTDSWEVLLAGQAVQLSKTEFKLLRLLALYADKVVERDFLLQEVWGFEAGSNTRTVDNFVMRVRKKLAVAVAAAGLDRPVLETSYGVGYSLRTRPADPADAEPSKQGA